MTVYCDLITRECTKELVTFRIIKWRNFRTIFDFVTESYDGGAALDWKFGDGVLALAGAITCDEYSGSSKSSLIPA